MTLLLTSSLLGKAPKRRGRLAKSNHSCGSSGLSAALGAEYQVLPRPSALPERKPHDLYAQIELKDLVSPSLKTAIGQRAGDEASDRKVKVRIRVPKQAKQKP